MVTALPFGSFDEPTREVWYRAFISYSHADAKWAKWLHGRLENYRIDRDLIDRQTAAGLIPDLRPIFRDRVTAGYSPSERTLAALDGSASLIVLCSPDAAKSHYVDEEVHFFKERHGDSSIIPIILDGSPGDPVFPPALKFEVLPDGAIDLRATGDGPDLALAARMLGVPTDDIIKRQLSAQNRRLNVSAAQAPRPRQFARTTSRPPSKPRGSNVFISYRRSDTKHVAGRIYDHLTRVSQIPDDEIFFDVDAISIGANFKQQIEKALMGCAVVLVLVGENWKRSAKWFGRQRVREDYVQSEIELALKLSIPIIPILVDNVEMPNGSELPISIAEFVNLNAARVRGGRDFHTDMKHLLKAIGKLREQGVRKNTTSE